MDYNGAFRHKLFCNAINDLLGLCEFSEYVEEKIIEMFENILDYGDDLAGDIYFDKDYRGIISGLVDHGLLTRRRQLTFSGRQEVALSKSVGLSVNRYLREGTDFQYIYHLSPTFQKFITVVQEIDYPDMPSIEDLLSEYENELTIPDRTTSVNISSPNSIQKYLQVIAALENNLFAFKQRYSQLEQMNLNIALNACYVSYVSSSF